MQAHHAAARKFVLTVDQLLEQLETGRDTSVALQTRISQHLNALAREVQTLEQLLPECAPAQHSLWRKKIAQLREQSSSQCAALGKFSMRVQTQQREAEEREALLGRGNSEQHAIMIDALASSQTLHRAGDQLDGLSSNAQSILWSLGYQQQSIKGVQRKVLDVANRLGVSNSVIRFIERRQLGDLALLYGGMLLTLALLWFSFVHLRQPST
ncbi:hypothetical protein AB1Y20_016605 [Prymnesium parvum]|uniref:Golgi SNAP receptor complex member 2 n=1 Tax=Prymnesium parvum TaxID=97485 RepID=A0AB34IB61_PRYPA